MWVQPNTLAAHLFTFLYLSPLGLQLAAFFSIKTCGAGQRFFLESRKEAGCVRFSGADFAAAVLLLSKNFIQPIFPASRERLICAVAVKGNFLRTVFG